MTIDDIQRGMDKTKEILDKVDILSLYDKREQMRVYELMKKVEDFVKSNSTLVSMMDKSFDDELFNFIDESEFIDYLTARYGNNIRFNEVITTFTYLSVIAKRPLTNEMLFTKGWKGELNSDGDYVFKHNDVYGFKIVAYDHLGTSVYYVHGTNICLKYEDELDAFVEMSKKLDINGDLT